MKKLSAKLAGLVARLPAAIPDSLIVAGVCLVSYGAWLLHPATGFIAGGVLVLVFGVLSAMKAGE